MGGLELSGIGVDPVEGPIAVGLLSMVLGISIGSMAMVLVGSVIIITGSLYNLFSTGKRDYGDYEDK